MNSPCYGCGTHEPGCHGTCERYAGFRAAIDEINRQRMLDKEAKDTSFDGMERKRKCASSTYNRRRTR